ncbi:hypothetical protein PF010_g28502 [Phytophthora fragariae]|uniref:Uncharacterized protein n=5 Tax=Phytophthora fragariae TaxID=53985 RepID=A0A6G0JQX1_9STRA|nr:hypothetical protein PF010_g28502 [Phytophthora fragariae]
MLTLVDYEKQREEAIKTHELVRLDYYYFTVAVRKGEVTSKDMYWILAQALGLHVQSLKHTETSKDGLNDKQWRVRVKCEACPTKLRPVAFIAVDDAELVVHHHEVHVNWPCKNCFSPDHPTKFCRTEEANAADSRQQHVLRVTGRLPSNKGHGGRTYKAQEQPRTLEQLQLILKGKAYGENNTDDQKGRAQGQASRSRAKSPNKRSQGFLFEKPTLPKEWEQHSPTRLQSEERKAEDKKDPYRVQGQRNEPNMQEENKCEDDVDMEDTEGETKTDLLETMEDPEKQHGGKKDDGGNVDTEATVDIGGSTNEDANAEHLQRSENTQWTKVDRGRD